MRAKGYKCSNVKCDRCVGNSMCGELGDVALNCVDRIITRQTNADRIRSMSDEEMCNWLFQRDCTNIAAFLEHGGMGVMDAVQLLDWLKQPAK